MTNTTPKHDPVNHPSHYTQYPHEVIEFTEHMNFNKGNAVKYISRAGFKDVDKEIEDLEKAAWYINREIELVKRKQAEKKATTTYVLPNASLTLDNIELDTEGAELFFGKINSTPTYEVTVTAEAPASKTTKAKG